MPREDYLLGTAVPSDMGSIMELEGEGFSEGIRESEEVLRGRLELFPEGFVLLRARGRTLGYLACERWDSIPPATGEGFALGEDPGARHRRLGPVLYLSSMTVHPSLRGGGFGSILFNEGRALIHRLVPGLETELLIVNESWAGARRIYRTAGFEERGSIPAFFEPSAGIGGAAIVMSRPVPLVTS